MPDHVPALHNGIRKKEKQTKGNVTMKDTLYIGSVGTSSIMETIQEAIRLTDGLKGKVIFSRDADRGREFARLVSVEESLSDYEQMLAREDVDIIYIASPNKYHFPQAKAALERGKHVIVEKPAAVTEEEVRVLYETAKANDVFFFEAITTLFMPNFLAVKQLLPRLGKLRKAWFSFGKYSSKYDAYLRGENPNIFNPEMQAGALNDMGIYCIHAAINLFGKPQSVRYEAQYGPNGIDLAGTLYLDYPDFTCELETAKHKDIPCGFLLEGSEGQISGKGHLNEVPDCAAIIQAKELAIDHQTPANRMIYEMARFRDAILAKDTAFFEEMAAQSMLAASILEQAHKKVI